MYSNAFDTAHIAEMSNIISEAFIRRHHFIGQANCSGRRRTSRCIAVAAASLGRLGNGIFSNRAISRKLIAREHEALLLPVAIYCAEAWTLRSLEAFETCCQGRQITKYQHQKPSQMSSNTLQRCVHVCLMRRHSRQAYKQDFNGQRKR